MSNCCNKETEENSQINNFIDLLKAISEPNRLRILCILSKSEICVCELAEKLNISRNLLSFHLRNLSKVSILDKRKEGTKIFFFIKKEWKPRINNFFKFVGVSKVYEPFDISFARKS